MIIQVQKLLNFELIFNEMSFFGAPVPFVHKLDQRIVLEEWYFFKACVSLKFVDQSLKSKKFSFEYHAIATDCHVVYSFSFFTTSFIFVYPLDSQVQKLLGMRFLQKSHNFRNWKDLILQQICESVMDWSFAFYFHTCWTSQWLNFSPQIFKIYPRLSQTNWLSIRKLLFWFDCLTKPLFKHFTSI